MRDERMQAARTTGEREVERFVGGITLAHASKVLRTTGARATPPQVDSLRA